MSLIKSLFTLTTIAVEELGNPRQQGWVDLYKELHSQE
jgi:hypothetical protein